MASILRVIIDLLAAAAPIITFIFTLAERKEGKEKRTASLLKDYSEELHISPSLISYWQELGHMATSSNKEPGNIAFTPDMRVCPAETH